MALLTLGVVLVSAAAGWRFLPVPPVADAEATIVETEEPAYLALGRDYYVHVKLIELRPRRAGGRKWEPRSASAPDIGFNLYWNGTRIFEGSERGDRLIGEWDLLRLDLKDALLSGQVEVAAAVNAPIVHAEAGGVLELEIWDDDVSFNDEAGRLELAVEQLHPGLNTLTPEAGGVARVVIDLVPRDTPLPDLLDRASRR
jgi:hypothetical protein